MSVKHPHGCINGECQCGHGHHIQGIKWMCVQNERTETSWTWIWILFFAVGTTCPTCGAILDTRAVRADAVKLQNRVRALTAERDERDERDEENRVKEREEHSRQEKEAVGMRVKGSSQASDDLSKVRDKDTSEPSLSTKELR